MVKFIFTGRITFINFLLSLIFARQQQSLLSVAFVFGLQQHIPVRLTSTSEAGFVHIADGEKPYNRIIKKRCFQEKEQEQEQEHDSSSVGIDKSINNNHRRHRHHRRQFLLDCCISVAATSISWSSFPKLGNAISYSENAKNLERISNKDFSGGAIYDNNPVSEKARKRRAMKGCKVDVAREEASYTILKQKQLLSEKNCNTMILSGESEFMLKALQNLNCPTCPNGISITRDTSKQP